LGNWTGSDQVENIPREISVRTSASAAKVQQIEAFVNTRLQEIGAALKSGDAQLVLTLALLNTTEELLDLQKAHIEDASLEIRLRGVLDKLESA
jgi:cell division protein ZapA (FtsZ GTPase activity inhibitor)